MKKRILVADGDPVFVEPLASRLRAKGLRVETTFDPIRALESAMRDPPDALVLDVKLTGAGLLTLRQLKVTGLTSVIPVVVVSACADPALSRAVANFGAKAFLRKPVSVEEICATVRWAMGEAAAEAPLGAKEAVEDAGAAEPIPILAAGGLV